MSNDESKKLWTRRDVLKAAAASVPVALASRSSVLGSAATIESTTHNSAFPQAMREIPESQKFTISQVLKGAPDEKGWYHQSSWVAATPEGLVSVYRRTDAHTAIISDIMYARSTDRGRTWTDHKLMSHSDVWNTGGCWVAPQLSRLKDGRLILIADFGNRKSGQDWPMLSVWQKPPRGMSNHLFWSSDNGKTWSGPHRIDEVGGEPGYIVELSNGTLVYTRTEPKTTTEIWDAPMPWGNNYYSNVAVFSDDKGKTWSRTALLADDPLWGDCEVGIVEMSPNNLMAMTRVGLGAGRFGQPSRYLFSRDNGRTWGDSTLGPIYGQRTIVKKLQSGKLLATYRNSWGTPASYLAVWDPEENLPYQPSSYIWDETRTFLSNGAMVLNTDEGRETGATFALYPAQAPDTRVEFAAELRVVRAEKNACAISVGCWVRITPDRVEIADRPSDGFAIDATTFHTYRFIRENNELIIYVNGELKLRKPVGDLMVRYVHFGNRHEIGTWYGSLDAPRGLGNEPAPVRRPLLNAGRSEWKSIRCKVDNKKDHSIDWKWNAIEGFPDQFRRGRMVRLDKNASFSAGHSGYSGWDQMADGTIAISDYTCGNDAKTIPYTKAYITTEKELLG